MKRLINPSKYGLNQLILRKAFSTSQDGEYLTSYNSFLLSLLNYNLFLKDYHGKLCAQTRIDKGIQQQLQSIDKSQYCDLKISCRSKQTFFSSTLNYVERNQDIISSIISGINTNKSLDVLNKHNIISVEESEVAISYIFAFDCFITIEKEVRESLIEHVKSLVDTSSNKQIKIDLFFDGAKKGFDSGTSGASVYMNNISIFQVMANLGVFTSNNCAEYFGLFSALIFLDLIKVNQLFTGKIVLNIFGDSNLVICHLNRKFALKNERLSLVYVMIKFLINRLTENKNIKVNFTHIVREFNSEADLLSQKAFQSIKASQIRLIV